MRRALSSRSRIWRHLPPPPPPPPDNGAAPQLTPADRGAAQGLHLSPAQRKRAGEGGRRGVPPAASPVPSPGLGTPGPGKHGGPPRAQATPWPLTPPGERPSGGREGQGRPARSGARSRAFPGARVCVPRRAVRTAHRRHRAPRRAAGSWLCVRGAVTPQDATCEPLEAVCPPHTHRNNQP